MLCETQYQMASYLHQFETVLDDKEFNYLMVVLRTKGYLQYTHDNKINISINNRDFELCEQLAITLTNMYESDQVSETALSRNILILELSDRLKKWTIGDTKELNIIFDRFTQLGVIEGDSFTIHTDLPNPPHPFVLDRSVEYDKGIVYINDIGTEHALDRREYEIPFRRKSYHHICEQQPDGAYVMKYHHRHYLIYHGHEEKITHCPYCGVRLS